MKRLTTLITTTLTLLASFTPLAAIDVSFDKFDNRKGLSSDQVSEVCQDEEGFIWIATWDALNCYTGNGIKVYNSNNEHSLSNSNIRAMCASANNTIWTGTDDKGINVLNRQTNEITEITTNTPGYNLLSDRIHHLFRDSKGRMWISTPAGITMYDPKTQASQNYLCDKNRKYVVVVYEDSKGCIYAGTWGKSVFTLDAESNKFKALEFQGRKKPKTIKSIFEDKNGNLWLGTWGGGLLKTRISEGKIKVLEHIAIQNEHYSKDYTFQIVNDIDQDYKGRLWLGTDVGIGVIHNPSEKNTKIDWIAPSEDKNGFNSKDARSILIDKANTIWVGTQGDGVAKVDFNTTKFTTYKDNADIAQNGTNTYRSFWYHKNELYTGINALGFGKYDLETKKFTSYKNIPELNGFDAIKKKINAIIYCTTVDDRYWWMITRYCGLIVYDTKENKTQHFKSDEIKGQERFLLHEGDKIWIGYEGALLLLQPDPLSKNKNFPYIKTIYQHDSNNENAIHGHSISSILRDKDNRLWVSFLDGGIDEIIENKDPEKTTFSEVTPIKENLKPLAIQTMYEDSRGTIWLGTVGNGLWIFSKDKKHFINYGAHTAIKGDKIFSIIEDNDAKIWISSNKGISSFQVIDLKIPYLTNFNAEDGLQGNIFAVNAVCKNSEGEILFGGYHGFNLFNPRKVKHNTFVPPMAFTAFEVDREPQHINYSEGEHLELDHKNNSCLIEFTALSYTKSINNQYQYILEGYDKTWIKTKNGDNKATYGQLPAGKYTFKVKGSNNNGIWNEKPLTIEIHVKKTPFKSALAYIIYVLATVLIFILSIYYTRRNFRLHQAVKDEQNERVRFEKINEFKLKFFTNISHELLTPLSIISNAVEQYIDRKPEEGAELAIVQRNTNRLTRLIDQLLDFRKVESSSRELQVEETDINQALSSLRDNFLPLCIKKNISFEAIGKVEHSIYVDMDKLDKILHNILSNAFKNTPENGEIRLEYGVILNDRTEKLTIKVINSGECIPEEKIKQIFDRFYRIDDHKHESGAGIGLAFTKSLVTLHKGVIEAENCTPEQGVCFTVKLPVSGWNYNEDEIAKEDSEPREVAYSFADEMDEIKIPLRDNREVTKELPKLLLVEDNHDMRNIMRNFLSKYFDIYQSENGIEGLETLDTVDIEVIVSDVMMPKMDGLTFCRKVKNNIATSHIPVILTTAKRTQENFIEGYEAHADSYITKPVNLQLLLVRIINLLEQRQKLQKRFVSKEEPETEELQINNLDQQLLEKVNEYINENLNDSELTVVRLAKHVNISTSVLYRKVKAYAGVSPNEYIRNLRLNHGAKLLKSGLNPSEVTYECGFSDPSYFGACFKKQFGVPPSKYVESL